MAKPSVLVADDDADVLEVLADRLRSMDVDVLTAADGKQALELIETKAPLVGLIDVQMPKADGMEVLRQVKADPKLKTVPVVMLTTSAREEEIVESYRCGANSYVVKPLDFGQFVKAIEELKLYWLAINSLPT